MVPSKPVSRNLGELTRRLVAAVNPDAVGRPEIYLGVFGADAVVPVQVALAPAAAHSGGVKVEAQSLDYGCPG